MTRYRYKALDADGIASQGLLEATDEHAAASQLHGRNLLVLQLVPTAEGSLAGQGWRAWFTRPPLSAAAVAQFTQQLATLLDAGQPLDRALNILLTNPADARVGALLERVREHVKAGKPLSSALGQHPEQFSVLYVSMVRAGEAGGSLAATLTQLAAYLERAQALRGEVINALIYPAFLVVGVLGSLALLMAYVVPQFVPIFADLGVPVPVLTQSVLWLGQGFSDYGLAALVTGVAALWWLRARLAEPTRRLRWDRNLLRLKLAGPLLQRLETARLARTLGTLLHNGVPLLAALAIGHDVCTNQALRGAVAAAADRVKDGAPLAASLEHSRLLPPLALQMVQVGEESGQLDTLLIKVADVFDREAKRSIDRLLAALVPSLTIVMAVLVAFIMLAIMLPLMSLTSNI
ncbi:type II secretion system inner membrane protein GspF [Pseudomonas japonica]|uniref:type II secretion system inner membrane protein GspF n=1 Tax=Pseudomonas japonica TaxID=256466 RepID=UPI0015E46B54|nr:type II secretion system inner membrane protein GspF [Pseudomonas japonica]MBA1242538.1 type II secretion system inner membrane protein GspF [Pseudomonas japonica]